MFYQYQLYMENPLLLGGGGEAGGGGGRGPDRWSDSRFKLSKIKTCLILQMIYLIKVSQFCISILISGAAAPKPPLNYAQSSLGSHSTRSGDQNGGPRDCYMLLSPMITWWSKSKWRTRTGKVHLAGLITWHNWRSIFLMGGGCAWHQTS